MQVKKIGLFIIDGALVVKINMPVLFSNLRAPIVIVQLFAGARELAGVASITLELPTGATVAQLRQAILTLHPELIRLLGRSRIAVNQEFADDSTIVPEGAEVALIPPVSGGAAP